MKAINLLPTDLRGASSSAAPTAPADAPGGIGAFVVLGALAACVIALAAYVLTTNMVKDRQAKLETVTAQTETATQRANQLKPYADFQAMAETRIQTVKDLASSRFDWEQAMRDISRTIPANVTLTSLNGTISSALAPAAHPPEPAAPACVPRSPHRPSSSTAARAARGRGDAAVAPSERRRRYPRKPRQVAQASAERDRQQAYYCHDDHDHDRVPGQAPADLRRRDLLRGLRGPAHRRGRHRAAVGPAGEQPATEGTDGGSASGFTEEPVDPAGNDPTGGGTARPPVPQGGGAK